MVDFNDDSFHQGFGWTIFETFINSLFLSLLRVFYAKFLFEYFSCSFELYEAFSNKLNGLKINGTF